MRSTKTSFGPKATKTQFYRADAAQNRLTDLTTRDNPDRAFKIGKYKNVSSKTDHDNKVYNKIKSKD